MVDIGNIVIGMQLLLYEPNILKILDKEGQRPGEIERELEKMWVLGKVFFVDLQRNEIALKVRDEIRTFSPEELWLLPSRTGGTTTNAPPDRMQSLMGFILSIARGEVNESALQEIADELKRRGATPTAPQELIEALT